MPRRDLLGGPGHVRGRAHVSGEHLDPARQRLPRHDRGADPVPARERVGIRRGENVEPLERRLPVLGRPLHLGVLPGPLRQPFGHRLPCIIRRDRAERLGRDVERPVRHAQRPRPLGGDRGRTTDRRARGLLRLAQSHEQDPRGRARRIHQRRLLLLAGEVARGQQPAERAAGGLVQLLERGRQPPAREGDSQERRLKARRGGGENGSLERHGSRQVVKGVLAASAARKEARREGGRTEGGGAVNSARCTVHGER